ncbi:MAG TPA: DUF1294 domain-containing protein [Candidatus Fimousia stercorigallinarum]|nr:DUF1294 domain-containing protein [Candidatus Fimousia stercorigallinarum]
MMKFLYIYLLVINVVAFCLYGLDKWKAKHNRWRISEATLILSAVIGGSLGAFCGMNLFRHKTKHKKFMIGVPVILVIQIAVGYFLYLWI